MRQPWLCLVIVSCLASPVLAVSIAGAFGSDAPSHLSEMAKYALGALASFLVNVPRGSVGSGNHHPEAPSALLGERKAA